MTLKGKTFVVTGAGSGIGCATALRLAELGAAGVAMSDINEAGLQESKAQCSKFHAKILIDKVDVSKLDQVEAWIRKAVEELGHLDGAANVAGMAGGDGQIIEDLDQSAWEKMISVNLNGVMHCMKAELAHITRPGGAIVNVASTAGVRALPRNAAYTASKFGVVGMTQSAAAEYGKLGVRINAVLPGPIDTQIFRDGEIKGLFDHETASAGTLMGRMGHAEEVAKVLAFLLSEETSYVTGALWTVDGGYSACGWYKAAH